MINQNSEILNKLFFTELQMLVEKYNNIDEVTKKQIESIVTSLRDEELQSYLMRNMDKLLDILKCTGKIDEVMLIKRPADIEHFKAMYEIDEEIVTFFVWYNFQINEITIGVARECIKELKENNYLEIGEYLIYQDERYLKEYARDLLEDRLDQEYYVDKLFEKETVIEMWINRTTKEEMINENLEETLELYPQEAFSIGGIQYKYSEIQ